MRRLKILLRSLLLSCRRHLLCLFLSLARTKQSIVRIGQVLFELLYRVHDCESLEGEISSREDDILPAWKYTPDRLECLTPHDDRMTFRRRAEVSEVLRDMPGDLPFVSYNTIMSHSSDGDVVDSLHRFIYSYAEENSIVMNEKINSISTIRKLIVFLW